MDIGLKTVITPYENPTQFTPDWRHCVAMAIHDYPQEMLPDVFMNDPHIMDQVEYLRQCDCGFNDLNCNFGGSVASRAFDIFESRNKTSIKMFLEPLLLTEQSFDIIAKDLGIGEDVVRYYEKIYWACRNDDEITHPSELLRTTFATDGAIHVPSNAPAELLWRVVGATLGYTALVFIWRWQKPAGDLENLRVMSELLTRSNMGKLFELSIKGELEAIDITAYLGQHINYERLVYDTKRGETKNEYAEIVCGLMQLLAPKMSQVAQTGEALRRYEEGAINVHTAEGNITDMEIDDMGALEARVTVSDKVQQALAPLAKQHEGSKK